MDHGRQQSSLSVRRDFFVIRVARGTGHASSLRCSNRRRFAAAARSQDGRIMTSPHFAPRAKAGHLPVSVRRAVAARTVRLQAASCEDCTAGAARLDPHGPAAHRHDLGPEELSRASRSMFKFAQHGKCGTWISELLPHTAKIVDDICLVRSMHTEAINHDPAITFIQTGSQQPGRPSFGAWLSYGLGSENDDLPAFVVMISHGSGNRPPTRACSTAVGQRLSAVEPSGRAASAAAAIRCCISPIRRASTATCAARCSTALGELNQLAARSNRRPGDRHAHRPVRDGLPHADVGARADRPVASEPQATLDLYGAERRDADGSFAAQLPARPAAWSSAACGSCSSIHRGWDQHGNLPTQHPRQCQRRRSAAGRADQRPRSSAACSTTRWSSGAASSAARSTARASSRKTTTAATITAAASRMWLAGGGIKPGITYGETDDYGYNIVENPVHIHDLNATILHCLGIDHDAL